MAIKRFNDYEKTQAYTEKKQLPKGGYVLKIMGAEVCEGKTGQYIKVSCDIAEGDYKDFYANDYRSQQSEDKKWRCNYLLNVPNDDGTEKDGWTKRRFKTVIEALEESNTGYHFDWDERKFKGKSIGGVFNIREFEIKGKIYSGTNLAQLCTVQAIKEDTYKIPADKLIQKKTAVTDDGFMAIPDTDADALPFD